MPNWTRLIAIGVALAMPVLLFAPLAVESAAPSGLDKAVHFVLFGLFLWSLGVLFPRVSRLAAAAIAIGTGALTELVQGFVGRDPSWGDLVADCLGVGVALFLWSAWRGFRPRRALKPFAQTET
jgi:hypothetical protein